RCSGCVRGSIRSGWRIPGSSSRHRAFAARCRGRIAPTRSRRPALPIGSEILEYEPGDLTCVVEAGIRLSALNGALGKHGQRLSLDPPGDPTLADCVLE